MNINFLVNGETADDDDVMWITSELGKAGIAVSSVRPGEAHTLTVRDDDEFGDERWTTISISREA